MRFLRRETEFARGYRNAKEAAEEQPLPVLKDEFKRCQIDDEYDRGYNSALRELEASE